MGQDRVLLDRGQERSVSVEPGFAAAKRGRQVEPKSVHAAVQRPGAQRVHPQAQRYGTVHSQDIAAAGIVDIERPVTGQPVVSGVVQAAQRQGRAELVALAGVVQHDVQDDTQAGRVQRVDGGAHLCPAAGGEPGIGGQEGNRVVAPVIGQIERRQVPLVDPGGAGHQLHRRDAEAGQMGDAGGMAEGRRKSRGWRGGMSGWVMVKPRTWIS